jgi:hypothetical protein
VFGGRSRLLICTHFAATVRTGATALGATIRVTRTGGF